MILNLNSIQTKRLLGGLFFAAMLIGCSSNSDSTSDTELVDNDDNPTVTCVTSDNPTENNDCGELWLAVTDAEGDFTSYTVDIESIELTRRDGTQVTALPTRQRIDFTNYVDLTELVTAATIPSGVYTSATLLLNYAEADIQVEKNGQSVAAEVVDSDGETLGQVSFNLQFDNRERLIIAPGTPAFMELDFNLMASHQVDTSVDPVVVTAEPFFAAEVQPLIAKEMRLRGPLVRVDSDNNRYRIALRPFYARTGRLGGVTLQTNDSTEFVVDGELLVGNDGLTALENLQAGSATVSFGELNRAERRFLVERVYAGTSVPGHDSDAAKGIVLARQGNQLELAGVTLIRANAEASFRSSVVVELAESTRVFRHGRAADELDIAAISVGQRVTILGDISVDDQDENMATLDATNGWVDMRLSSVAGHLNAIEGSNLVMDLQSMNGVDSSQFDYSGTGIDPSFDASASAYEVDYSRLSLPELSDNAAIRARGFVRSFGGAPADFDALSIIDYSAARSELLVSWQADAAAPLSFTEQQIELNLTSEDLGPRHLVNQSGIRFDLTELEQNLPLMAISERGLYGFSVDGRGAVFSDFASFSQAIEQELAEGRSVKWIYASGGFNASEPSFNAYKIAIVME